MKGKGMKRKGEKKQKIGGERVYGQCMPNSH